LATVAECLPDYYFEEMERDDGYSYITIGQTFVDDELHPLLVVRILDNMESQPEVQLKILGGS